MNGFRIKFILIALGSIMFIALVTRYNTFWEPHWSGDQEIYTALAMKLSKGGLNDYNLRGIDVKKEEIELFGGQLKVAMGEVVPAPEGDMGTLLKIRYQYGLKHYDQPLYFIAPAFPYCLMLSNNIFSPGKRYTGSSTSINRLVFKLKPDVYFNNQFYAAIVPFIFGLFLILLTFFLGKLLFSDRIGLYSAAALAFNPVSILSSQRIWTDDMCASFITLSAIMFILSIKQPKRIYPLLTGVFIGIAVLTRQSAIIILPVFLLFNFVGLLNGNRSGRNAIKSIFDISNLLIIAGFAAVTAFWFIKVYSTYHTFFYMPDMKGALATDKTNWWELTRARPHPLVLFTVGLPYIWPLMIFAYLVLKETVSSFTVMIRELRFNSLAFLALWVSVFIVFIVYMGDMAKEYRYMIPAYPALSVMIGLGLARARDLISKHMLPNQVLLPEIILLFIILVSGIWSSSIGVDAAVCNRSEIVTPF